MGEEVPRADRGCGGGNGADLLTGQGIIIATHYREFHLLCVFHIRCYPAD